MKYVILFVYLIFGTIALSVFHVASVDNPILQYFFVPLLTVFLTAPVWLAMRPALRYSKFILIPYVLFIGFCTAAEYVEFLRNILGLTIVAMAIYIWIASRYVRKHEIIGPVHALTMANLFSKYKEDSDIFIAWAQAAANVLGHHLGKETLTCTESSLADIELALQKPAIRERIESHDIDELKLSYIGAFIGEIMRQEIGGLWVYDSELDLWVMALNNGPKANPFEKVKKFYAGTDGESLIGFYKSSKALCG